ncbi:hypothetical protein, partial [Streptococcus anginosus]|uniref:hypothetical protein n=1 Tax=Streptococcus anginosus TaxID=1328 RepID=UPI002ED9D3CB
RVWDLSRGFFHCQVLNRSRPVVRPSPKHILLGSRFVLSVFLSTALQNGVTAAKLGSFRSN